MENNFTSDISREISYGNIFALPRSIILKALPILDDTLREMFPKRLPTSTFEVADLGSSVPNAFLIISQVIESINGICQQAESNKFPQIRVFLNDLPENDFNALFLSVPGFFERLKRTTANMGEPACFIAGVTGSFYGRLFPSRSLHFMHSSTSLHWLSKAPPGLKNSNREKIYITKSSPGSVIKAYAKQFKKDFSTFLSSRSQELVVGGQMLLILLGRHNQIPWSEDCCFTLLGESLVDLFSEGLAKEEDVDTFNLAMYTPCKEELHEIIEREGSFGVDKMEIYEIEWDPRDKDDDNDDVDLIQSGQNFSNLIRRVVGKMISGHFGEAIIDRLFTKYAARVTEHLRDQNKGKLVNVLISVTKK